MIFNPPITEIKATLALLREQPAKRVIHFPPYWLAILVDDILQEHPEFKKEGVSFDVLADIIEMLYILRVLDEDK